MYILSNTFPYSKLSDNEDELDLHCIQLAEKIETNNVSGKRQRKKSRMAKESDEMDFIVSRVVPSEPKETIDSDEVQQPLQQQQQQQRGEEQQQTKERSQSNVKKTAQDKTTKSTPVRKEKHQKSSKKEEQKKKKIAQIEAGKTQAEAFFKERLSAANNLNKQQPAGLKNHSPSPSQSPLLQNTSTDLPSLGVSPLTLHDSPLHTSPPTQSSSLYNSSLLQSSQSLPEHTSLHMSEHLPSDLNPRSQSLLSPISIHRNPVDLTILPSVAAPTLGETGSLIRSSLHNAECSTTPSNESMTLDSSFGSLSDDYSSAGDDELMDELVIPCERCSKLVNELRAEVIALRKRQLPG